jgi:hypothetical protein
VGLLTLRDLSNATFSLEDTGGKKGFIENVTGRKGLPQGTKIGHMQSTKAKQVKLDMDVGSSELPHPYKKTEGVADGRRSYGAADLCSDNSLCEGMYRGLR